jgi:hypothetical protein
VSQHKSDYITGRPGPTEMFVGFVLIKLTN